MAAPSNRRDRIVARILDGATVAEAAKAEGVSDRTVYRHIADDAVQAHIRQHRAALTEATTATLGTAAQEAVALLRGVIGSRQATNGDRIRAAVAVLAEARAWRDADVEARLTALEAEQAAPALRAV